RASHNPCPGAAHPRPISRENAMKSMLAGAAVAAAADLSLSLAQDNAEHPRRERVEPPAIERVHHVPRFQGEPLWPKTLPHNWIPGQVSGIAVDRYDRIWVVHRPSSLTPRERAAEQNPPEAKCCVAAPPVLVFDQSGNVIKSWGGSGQGYEW